MLGADFSVTRRVLAYRAGGLGDTLLLLPALAALRKWAGPGGRVELVGTAPFARLAVGERHAHAVHDAGRAMFRGLFDDGEDLELRGLLSNFDVVVAWTSAPRLPSLAAELGLESVIAPALPKPAVPASVHYLRTLSPLSIQLTQPVAPPRLRPTRDAAAQARRWLAARNLAGEQLVAIHPSSGSRDKNWPMTRFVRLAERCERSGSRVLWIRGPADDDTFGALSLDHASVARDLDLEVVAALLSFAHLYVGNDSGVTHLAAAVGAPVLAVFGPTDPEQWAPRGKSVHVTKFDTSVAQMWGFARELMKGLYSIDQSTL